MELTNKQFLDTIREADNNLAKQGQKKVDEYLNSPEMNEIALEAQNM